MTDTVQHLIVDILPTGASNTGLAVPQRNASVPKLASEDLRLDRLRDLRDEGECTSDLILICPTKIERLAESASRFIQDVLVSELREYIHERGIRELKS